MPFSLSRHTLDDPDFRARWDALAERSPQHTPWSALAYYDALALPGITFEGLLVDDGEADRAGLLVPVRRRGPFRAVVGVPLTPYLPFLLDAPLGEADVHLRRSALEALLGALEQDYDQVTAGLPPAFTDVRLFQWRGWRVTPRYTYIAELHDDVRLDWSSSTRRTFRGESDAYDFSLEAGPADVVRLCLASYRRQGRGAPVSEQALVAWAEALCEAGLARACCVHPRGGDNPTGGIVVLRNGTEAAYWLAGSNPGPAMTVLLGHLLPRLRAQGVDGFDMVGANTPSIAEFKRRLGADLRVYYGVEYVRHPMLKVWRHLRELVRKDEGRRSKDEGD